MSRDDRPQRPHRSRWPILPIYSCDPTQCLAASDMRSAAVDSGPTVERVRSGFTIAQRRRPEPLDERVWGRTYVPSFL